MITAPKLAALKRGEWKSDGGPRGAGRLQARKLDGGVIAFYFRYTASDGERVRLPMMTGKADDGSLKLARARAVELRQRFEAGATDLRDVLDDEARAAAKVKRDAEAAEAVRQAKEKATLGLLLDAYADGLERAGKASAASVRRCLHRNIRDAMPSLWATPAAHVTTDDLLDAVARLADADKLREAGKLRAYLRAAYAVAMQARRNAKAAPALRAMRLAHNPAADLATVEGSTSARDRALSEAELQAYWRRIVALSDPDGALLRFHLLTGAQRVEQLARLTADDLRDGGMIRLRDGKGRRKQARNHDLPMLPDAVAALQAMKGGEAGPYLFSATHGDSPATYAVVQHRVRGISEAMLAAGELKGGAFTPGDLRRTVETRLAAAGIDPWIRAQLQSHGIGGVQAKHYDRHDYLPEKRAALETLHRILTGASAKVVAFKRKA